MNATPETRVSLITRLSDHQDAEAWNDFFLIYEPLVLRMAIANGLQVQDASDVVQEVMIAVARAVDTWDPDKNKGRFRDWLFRIAKNLMINHLTRRKCQLPTLECGKLQRLINGNRFDGARSDVFESEYKRAVFQWAAEKVRQSVSERTWQLFWQTAVDGRKAACVANECAVPVEVVYVAKSRVFAKIKRQVEQLEGRVSRD